MTHIGSMLGQCHGLSKIWKHFTTLAQRWPNVVPPTNIGNRMGMSQVDIGPTMGQRCVPNSNGPTITRRWSSIGPTLFTQSQQTNHYPTLAQCMHAIWVMTIKLLK